MIYVDVYIPALDQDFDTFMDDECESSVILQEMIGMLHKIAGQEGEPDSSGFTLFSATGGFPIPPKSSLKACGVVSGSRLILT